MPLFAKAHSKEEETRAEGAWDTIKTLFYAILLAMVFRSLFFEPFHIPSGSMRATLLEGDYIFVSKYSYGYSRYSFPFGVRFAYFENRLAGSMPKRGDVAVFRKPTDPKIDFIKRIIGLPGDTVQVTGGVLILNSEPVEQTSVDNFVFMERGEEQKVAQNRETLPGGASYLTLDASSSSDGDFTELFHVPEGYVFAMGDNRDHSTDSRFPEVGFVPIENLIGRAEVILFSVDKTVDFEFWEFWKYPSMFRGERFWQTI